MKKPSGFTNLINLIIKHPIITLSCVVTGLLIAFTYIYLTPVKYMSTASLEHMSSITTPYQDGLFSSGKTPATEILTSQLFIMNAIKGNVNPISLFITQDFKKSVASSSFPFVITHKTFGTRFKEQEYTIEEINNNSYLLTSISKGILRAKTGKFGEEITDQEVSLIISKKKITPYEESEIFQAAKWSFIIQTPEAIAANLTHTSGAINVTESNNVITITCRHENPSTAQEITQALAKNFLTSQQLLNTTTTDNSSFIDAQLAEMSIQLEATEAQIAQYKRANSITDMHSDTEKNLDVLKNLQIQKSQLKLSLAALENTSDYLRKNRQINNSNVEYGTIADPVFSEQIALLNSKYELKEKGNNTTSNEEEIESIKTRIAERILNTRKKTTIQINKLNQEIFVINSQLSTLPEKANILNALDRKLSLDKKVYDLLAENRAQYLVNGGGSKTRGRILKPASAPEVPFFPGNWLLLTAGCIAGLLLSMPLNIVAEKRQSRSISNRQQITKQSQIPFIGTISGDYGPGMGLESSISELCTKVILRKDAKMITFASTNKGEGKTFIATHFAQAFAAMDKKVLVLDMNADNPAIAQHFKVTPERSLSDVLEGFCDVHDAICLTSYPNLDVLACGNLFAGVNSLLASRKRDVLLESLKKHYDIIVTDTTGIGTRIDALPLMKLSDLNLFIIKADATSRQSLIAAEEMNKDYEIQNLFFLMNAVQKNNNTQVTNQRRSRVRSLSTTTTKPKESYVPSLLKKIALWFY